MAHVISEECVACGTCAEECPVEAIKEGEPYVIDEEKCTDCGSCVEVCATASPLTESDPFALVINDP